MAVQIVGFMETNRKHYNTFFCFHIWKKINNNFLKFSFIRLLNIDTVKKVKGLS